MVRFHVNKKKFSAGERCKRCAMVNISQTTGQKQPETLAVMSLYRREKEMCISVVTCVWMRMALSKLR